jgi:hypothetical protein
MGEPDPFLHAYCYSIIYFGDKALMLYRNYDWENCGNFKQKKPS